MFDDDLELDGNVALFDDDLEYDDIDDDLEYDDRCEPLL